MTTSRRTPHTTRTRADSRAEAVTTPCLLRPEPFDSIVTTTRATARANAVAAIAAMCGRCPIQPACYRDNRKEPWALALAGKPIPEVVPQDTGAGRALRQGWAARNAARLADLRNLIDAGADLPEICDRLGVTRSGLWKWCRNHARPEWEALTADSEYGNQWRTTKHGHISTRRKKVA